MRSMPASPSRASLPAIACRFWPLRAAPCSERSTCRSTPACRSRLIFPRSRFRPRMPTKARPPSRRSARRGLSMPEGQILVTGANRGIGAAIASELAAAGLSVVGLTRSGTAAAGTAIACDVSDEGAIARAIGAVAEQGPIAGLVNNAGLYEAHPSAELAAADFERMMRINATSVVVAARHVYPHLKRAGGGLIVNIGYYYDKLGVAKTVD